MGDPGYSRRVVKTPAETMKTPSPTVSMRYSGQWRRRASIGRETARKGIGAFTVSSLCRRHSHSGTCNRFEPISSRSRNEILGRVLESRSFLPVTRQQRRDKSQTTPPGIWPRTSGPCRLVAAHRALNHHARRHALTLDRGEYGDECVSDSGVRQHAARPGS